MKVDQVVDLLVEAGMGVGSVAFACHLSTLHVEPKLELTSDGFMIAYGPYLGIYVFRNDDIVYCSQINGDLSETYALEDQYMATALFGLMMFELLAA